MRHLGLLFTLAAFVATANAAWYWPFGSDEDEVEVPRLSMLMSPASRLIDDASDLAYDGKLDDAIEKYREALRELDRIEQENPDRAATPEFATFRNKRAYVNAAIDSLLMKQAHDNARAVAVTDTAALEQKMAEEKRAKKEGEGQAAKAKGEGRKAKGEGRKAKKPKISADGEPSIKKASAAYFAGEGAVAEQILAKYLEQKPGDAAALNLRAICEATRGAGEAARQTLDEVIVTHPRDYRAYYNMANLYLQSLNDKDKARRYYQTGRAFGGPQDEDLEAALK